MKYDQKPINTKIGNNSEHKKHAETDSVNIKTQECYYDYTQLDFNFNSDELKDEPIPEYVWIHLSCLYWIPEIFFDNSVSPFEPKNIKGIDKEKYKSICSICNTNIGVCVKCSYEKCDVKFHVECARKANIHLEMVIEHNTKFNIHCAEHTTKLIYNLIQSEDKKTQNEIIKFYKYLQRFAKSNGVNVVNSEVIDIRVKEKTKPQVVNEINEISDVR